MLSRPRKTATSATEARQPPFVGAHLRMTYQAARRRQLQAQAERGFTDINQAHLSVLVYPPPDGVRPSELAERTYMTKQAMNYLLAQLESLGYIERRARSGQTRRLVYLTERGWRFYETQWASMQALEAEWAERVGPKRFDAFMSTLRELSTLNGQDAPRPPPNNQGKKNPRGKPRRR
jgi:DNA-binding MarR family transcriptional regulator